MAEVSNELIDEVLKQVQDRLTPPERRVDEVKSEIQPVRIQALATQKDIQNIYSILERHDSRLDRIERRLEPSEVPA
jgi:chromosome segregation ATPase